MRVVKRHERPDRLRLVLASNHWLLMSFAALFLAAGAAVIWMMAYDVALSVENGVFRFTRRLVGLMPVEEVVLAAADIRSVSIELTSALGGFSRSYEVTIAGPDGVWRPWLVAADGDAKRAIADGVRQALADRSRRFEYAEDASLTGLILGGLLSLAGLYVLSVIQAVVIAGDRLKGSLVVTRRRLLLPGGAQRTLAIADILRCATEASSLATPRGHNVTSYRVVLQVREPGKGEESVPLGAGPSFTEAEASSLARTINAWLATPG